MKRIAAYRFLILVLALSAVLSLPGGLLAAVGAQAPGCPHCQGAGPGLVAGCCCCLPDMPGPCGASAQGGASACRCSSGSGPASISLAVTGTPAWQASSHVLAIVTVSSKNFSPNIFHPPESSRSFSQG
jgi:hypothetical protein